MTPVTEVKTYPVQAFVGGVLKWIGIVMTEQPDSLGGSGLLPCGEFDPNRAYSLFNMVTISTGSNSGTWYYISTTMSTGAGGTNPTQLPYAGGGQWFQMAGASAAADYMTMI